MWSSRLAFILAATGSAVGLGNIWKFPYITGEYGGGAFVLVYLLCIALIGAPILIAEVMLGRRGRQSPIKTMASLARTDGASPRWALLGWMGVLAAYLILSFYAVIGGWSLAYVGNAASGDFAGADSAAIGAIFGSMQMSDPYTLLSWHSLFMVLVIAIVSRGLRVRYGESDQHPDAAAVPAASGDGGLRHVHQRFCARRLSSCSSRTSPS